MIRLFIMASAAALTIGATAQAQDSLGRQQDTQVPPEQMQEKSVNPPSAVTAPGTDASAAVFLFPPGTEVIDRSGAAIGTVNRVGQAADGAVAVAVSIGGKSYDVAPAILSLSGD